MTKQRQACLESWAFCISKILHKLRSTEWASDVSS